MRVQRSTWLRGGIIAATALGLVLLGFSAQAATRNMVGSIGVLNPSVKTGATWETGPFLFGIRRSPGQILGQINHVVVHEPTVDPPPPQRKLMNLEETAVFQVETAWRRLGSFDSS